VTVRAAVWPRPVKWRRAGSFRRSALLRCRELYREARRTVVPQNREELLKALNKALGSEYGALWLLPQHIAQIQDEELARQLKLIADVELEHAEKTARMIYSLGGEPNADLPQLRPRSNVREILEAHIEGERQAIANFEEAAGLADDPKIRRQCEDMKREEEGHQRLLERALERL
jgi:bacterioferritin